MTADAPVVLVDARNVMRSRWPNIGEDRFLQLAGSWAAEEGARILAVFDGRAPGDRLGVHELDGRTTVVGTGRESADDWIAAHATGAQDGGRLWLVSSDRELRRRVAGRVERVIGGGSFAGRLEALTEDLHEGRRYYRATGEEERRVEEALDGGDDE